MAVDTKNVFPTVNGKLYRVTFTRGGRALCAFRRFAGKDQGAALVLDGVLGRKVVAAGKALL